MKTSRKILKNLFSLSLAEIANKGITLVTAAYLSRAILADGFGILGFANAITIYFVVFVVLGFNTVGIREVAKSQENIPKIVNAILSIRLLIAVISFVIYVFIVIGLDRPLSVKWVLLIASLNFFSYATMLDWFYQGIEKMEIQALRQVVTGLLTLIGTVLLVHNTSDVFIAMAVTVLSTALNSVWMMTYYVKLFGRIRLTYDKELWIFLLKSSIPIGLTALIITNYNNLNTILLGIFRNDFETGIYSAAYKVLAVTILPATIVQNTFFPILSRAQNPDEKIRIMKKFTSLLFMLATIISGIVFTYSDSFIHLLFGRDFYNAIPILKILMFTSILMFINVSLSAPLTAWNKEKSVLYAIGAGGLASTVANFLMIPVLGYYGAAYVTILSEIVVMVGLGLIYFKLIKRFFISDLLKCTLYTSISCGAGYFIMNQGVGSIISAIISLLLFAGINLLFKTVTIAELKGYISK